MNVSTFKQRAVRVVISLVVALGLIGGLLGVTGSARADTTLTCTPATQTIQSGQTVSLTANGGSGFFFWNAPSGDPQFGFSQSFSTRFNSSVTETKTITLQSGNLTTLCYVTVLAGSNQSGVLTVQNTGRNITKNTIERTSLTVSPGDNVQFVIRVRNNTNARLTNVVVNDILAAALTYRNNTTTINGVFITDGITDSGINIGSLSSGQEAIIRFSVTVGEFPATTTLENIAVARADNTPTVSVRMRLSRGQIAGAAAVNTGPGSTLFISLLLSLLVTGTYMRYTGTEMFRRRSALALVRRLQHDSQRLNFARFN